MTHGEKCIYVSERNGFDDEIGSTLHPHSCVVAIETQRQRTSSCKEFSSGGTVAVSVDGIEGLWEAAEETPIGVVSSLQWRHGRGHTCTYTDLLKYMLSEVRVAQRHRDMTLGRIVYIHV